MVAEPSPARRRLATELTRLRALAKISGREMADATGLSQSSISRMESGWRVPARSEVLAWLRTAGADAAQSEWVLAALDAAVVETVRWRDALPDVGHLQDHIATTERSAGTVRNFQPLIVPGLLQTRSYAKHYLPLVDPEEGTDIDAAVESRMQRQQLLLEPGRRFEFLVTDSGLRRPVVPEKVLDEQLDQITNLARLDTVHISVVPEHLVPVARTPFVLLEGADDGEPYVRIELATGMHTISEPEDVETYRRLFANLAAAAQPIDQRRR